MLRWSHSRKIHNFSIRLRFRLLILHFVKNASSISETFDINPRTIFDFLSWDSGMYKRARDFYLYWSSHWTNYFRKNTRFYVKEMSSQGSDSRKMNEISRFVLNYSAMFICPWNSCYIPTRRSCIHLCMRRTHRIVNIWIYKNELYLLDYIFTLGSTTYQSFPTTKLITHDIPET